MHSDILTSEAVAYFYFKVLPEDVKAANKIKLNASEKRLDCVSYSNPNNWKGFDFCISPSGKDKNRLFWTLRKAYYRQNVNVLRRAEYQFKRDIKKNPENISSLYIEHETTSQLYGYGYFSNKQTSGDKDTRPNPFYVWHKDLFLILINPEYTIFEFLIFENGRNLHGLHLKNLIQGEYNSILDEFRKNSTPFYEYKNLEL